MKDGMKDGMKDNAKVRGRKPTSQTQTMITVRCDNAEQYQQITKFARQELGVSVNTFILTTILNEIAKGVGCEIRD